MKWNWYFWIIVILILFLAAYIKTYRLQEFASYGFETAQQYLEMIKLHEGTWQILGPRTSHEWLRLSALPYYVLYPVWKMSGFSPLFISYFWTFLSISLIGINVWVVRKWWGRKAAVITTLLLVVCGNLLQLDRANGLFALVVPLSYWYLWEIAKERVNWGKVILAISIMCTLHAAALILLIPTAILMWKDKQKAFGWKWVVGAVLVQSPILWNNAASIIQLVMWLPYKVWNFGMGKTLGLGGSVIIDKTWEYIGNFFVRSFFTWEVPWWIGVVLIIIFVGRWWAIRNKESERVEARLLIVLLMGIIALIVHKNPPTHYFGPILLLPTIIVGYWISKLRSGVALAVMASLVLLNCGYILSERYLGKQIAGIGYYEQVRVVEAIKSDAAGRELSIERVGEFDQYDNQAKDNYQYLLIHMGAKLRDKAETGYIISEYIYNGCSDKLEIGRTKNVVICLKGDE